MGELSDTKLLINKYFLFLFGLFFFNNICQKNNNQKIKLQLRVFYYFFRFDFLGQKSPQI